MELTHGLEQSGNGFPERGKNLHFRVLAVDTDRNRLADLETSFMAMYIDPKDKSAPNLDGILARKDAEFFFAQSKRELADAPSFQTINTAWIHMGHPDCQEIAKAIYARNVFCCVVFYGDITLERVLSLSSCRPVGYLQDVTDKNAVFQMLHLIWELSKETEEKHPVLRLTMRDTFYNIPLESILYCESESVRHKCYLYIKIEMDGTLYNEEEGYFLKDSASGETVAYVYNGKLDTLAEKLPEEMFLRIHKSCLVNKRFVRRIRMGKDKDTGNNGWIVSLADRQEREIQRPVSVRYRKAVKDWWESRDF